MCICHSFPPMLPRSLSSLFESKLCDSALCKNELSSLLIIFMFIFLHFNMVFLKINYDVKCKYECQDGVSLGVSLKTLVLKVMLPPKLFQFLIFSRLCPIMSFKFYVDGWVWKLFFDTKQIKIVLKGPKKKKKQKESLPMLLVKTCQMRIFKLLLRWWGWNGRSLQDFKVFLNF